VDRGLFRSMSFKSFKDDENRKAANPEEFCKPNPMVTIGGKKKGLHNLDGELGCPNIGSAVFGGDVIIGKTMTLPAVTDDIHKAKMLYKDCSTTIKHTDAGVVNQVMLSMTEDGKRMIKVKVANTNIPEIGDKLASRAAQKGTIGMILNEEDMPFTREGIRPDIIINSHCIPS
jgi:DNA-directed RNA polymerase II subunit RPB2